MIDPVVLLLVLLAVACLLLASASVLYRLGYREDHPSLTSRRRELDREVMMDEITAEQYAERKDALDREAENARLVKRLRREE